MINGCSDKQKTVFQIKSIIGCCVKGRKFPKSLVRVTEVYMVKGS